MSEHDSQDYKINTIKTNTVKKDTHSIPGILQSCKSCSDNGGMSEWKECKLGGICTDISYGFTESATAKAIGPKFLRITDIVPDRISWDHVPYCEADKQMIEKYKLYEGDIVIARTGATTEYNKIIKKRFRCNFCIILN